LVGVSQAFISCYDIAIIYHLMWHFVVASIILCYAIYVTYYFKCISSSCFIRVFILL
jgi:hypothetical protein